MLLPLWLCGNSSTWALAVQLHIADIGKPKKPKSLQQAEQEPNTASFHSFSMLDWFLIVPLECFLIFFLDLKMILTFTKEIL